MSSASVYSEGLDMEDVHSNHASMNEEPEDEEQDGDFQTTAEEDVLKGIDTTNVDELLHEVFFGLTSDKSKAFIKRKVQEMRRILPVIKKFGLLPQVFNAVFEVAMQHKLSSKEQMVLLQSLLPRKNISGDYVVRIIACINRKDKKPKYTVNIQQPRLLYSWKLTHVLQADLLNWAISVYDAISEKDKIRQLYNVLFYSLYHESTRQV
ncbi:hypothetical protein MBANPS3_002649 [Mucor bainieri]